MKTSPHRTGWYALSLVAFIAAGSACRESTPTHAGPEHNATDVEEAQADHDGHGHEKAIAIPPTVRMNLGIEFVRAERRAVRRTIRLPGQFELQPQARREYHVMLAGRVTLLVNQYDRVEAGDPLFHLDAPDWQKMQSELVDAYNAMRRSHTELDVAEATLKEREQAVAFLQQRLANLAEAQVRRANLEAELAEKENTLPRLHAQREAARLGFDTAHSRYDVILETASSVTGISRDVLDPRGNDHRYEEGPPPAWRSITRLTVRAEASGVVDRVPVTNRGWLETGDLVLDTIAPNDLRFHADALQTDIALFADGQPARIVPPVGGSIDLQDTADGRIDVGFQAHAAQRTVPIYLVPEHVPGWAKAGVIAYLEVYVDGDAVAQTAVPEAAVVRDGLDRVIFVRDHDHPDQVFRLEALLGASDGRWVEVLDGLHPGDEVVLAGVYPLMLASSSSGETEEAGHFHADGTFHPGDEH